MLCWEYAKWNHYNSTIWSLQGKPIKTKDIIKVGFPTNLLANVLTNKTKQLDTTKKPKN